MNTIFLLFDLKLPSIGITIMDGPFTSLLLRKNLNKEFIMWIKVLLNRK